MATDDDIPGFPASLLPDNVPHFPEELAPYLQTLERWEVENWRRQEAPPTAGGAAARLAWFDRLMARHPARLEHAAGAAAPTMLQIAFADGSIATFQLVAPGDLEAIWPPELGPDSQALRFFASIRAVYALDRAFKVSNQQPLWGLVRDGGRVEADFGEAVGIDGHAGERGHEPALAAAQPEAAALEVEGEALEDRAVAPAEPPTRH
jgi:hypothetical protein